MTYKRVFTLFLCLLISGFVFFGPQFLNNNRVNYEDYHKDNDKSPKWQGVITIWDYPRLNIKNGTRFSWIKKKISEFEKANPGVYIELRTLSWSQGPSVLLSAAEAGALPDIAPVGSDYYFQYKGLLEPLNDRISLEEKADFIDKCTETVVYNGKMYGIPWMMTGYTMLLNTDMFKAKEVPLPKDGNWTYDEFVDAMKKLTYDTNGRGGPDVYGFNSFIQPGYYNIFGLLLCDGAQIIDCDTGKYVFDYPEAISALTRLCELKYKHKATHPSFGIMNENQAWTSFVNGKVAAYTAGSWTVPLLRNLPGDGRINFTVANYPTGKAEMPLTINSMTCSYGVFKQKNEKKLEMCIEFIKFLTSRDSQNDLVNFGFFPVRKSGKNLYENDKEMYTIQQSLNFAEPLPRHHNWHNIDIILQEKLTAAINGELEPAKALNEAKVQIEKYIK